MPFYDMPLEELEDYRPDIAEPDDLDAFWARTLAASSFEAASVTWQRVPSPLCAVEVYDVTFGGYAGDPVRAWLTVPAPDVRQAGADQPLPTVVEFIGMGGGRGLHFEHLTWACAGYAHLFVDTRGQGSHWGSGGHTPDPHGNGPATAGFMTHGIESPDTYLYRRLFTDAHHAVEAAAVLPQVDASRIAVTGISQGGGMTIAAAALNHRVVAAMPDVPFMCHLRRAIGLADHEPYNDMVTYLSVYRGAAPQAFATLSYFDAAALARRASAPALFSAGLMDVTCPPSTVFAARNLWGEKAGLGAESSDGVGAHGLAAEAAGAGAGEAAAGAGEAGLGGASAGRRPEIRVYPFNDHEGGGAYQWREQEAWLSALLGLR